MKLNTKYLLISAVTSLVFILVTGYFSYYSYENENLFQDFCVNFHTIAVGMYFLGFGNFAVTIYYFILWIFIGLCIRGFIYLIDYFKQLK